MMDSTYLWDEVWRVLALLELGGGILVSLLGVSILLWGVIVARFLALRTLPARLGAPPQEGFAPRRAFLRAAQRESERGFFLLRTLIALAPLLGLLGTVTGLMQMFDAVSAGAALNLQALGQGAVRAVLPTMVGMGLALAGMFCLALLKRRAQTACAAFAAQAGM